MPDTLRDRIRTAAADAPAPARDLPRVAGRARTLRIRRLIASAIVVALSCAAVAVPLISLRDLEDGRRNHHRIPAGPTFGDGRVSFHPTEGWTLLQGGRLSACATTAAFAELDVQQSRGLGPNTILGCSASVANLPPDGVLLNASASDAYRWERPNVNFPASTLPPTLDPTTCGVRRYEGQLPGTTKCQLLLTANDRQVAINVWIGTETPSEELMMLAQEGLDSLAVSEPASLGNDIAFEPAHGWHDEAVTPTTVGALGALYELPSAWTSDVELTQSDGPSPSDGLSNDAIRRLPADGVIVSVEQWITTRNPLPDTPDFQSLPDRPNLAHARLITGGWEGMPAEDVSQLYVSGVLNGRPVIVQAYFRTQDPSPDLITQAQIGLNRLVVVPLPAPTTELRDLGVSMELPDGWQGWLYSFSASAPTLVATTSEPQNPLYPRSVTQSMRSDDVAIVLEEGTTLQDLRWPAIDGPPQIGPENLCVGCEMLDGGQPPTVGHVLYRNTFTTGGRAFDLYVEFGSAPGTQQLDDVNSILGTLQLAPGPNPEPASPGGTAVGSLPGGAPGVGPTDAERTLSWTYEFRVSISVPEGWTGATNLVADSADPLNVFALGSWDVSQGGYCAPLTALRQLPSDGALIWIDRYESRSSADVQAVPWPSSPQVGPGTEPLPSPTECTAAAPVQSFAWALDGRTYAVHVAFGPNVTDTNVEAASRALASFTGP
jgi:hypothetical protein